MLLLLLALQAPAETPATVVERDVRLVLIDPLDRRREIHRRERVAFTADRLCVTDLTFGTRLIVRSDLRKAWVADPLAGTLAEIGFEELARRRSETLDGLEAAKARVPGTPDEKAIVSVLEGFDRFPKQPGVELRSEDGRREVVVNGEIVKLSFQGEAGVPVGGYLEVLARLGAFHPEVAGALSSLKSFPAEGTLRYVLFLDRVVERFTVRSAKAQAVPAAEFEPPAGLQRVPMPGFAPAAEREPVKPGDVRKDFREDDADRKERGK
ncbi:MAG TPA: hypothetical protein VEJ18_07060 [Planctomycetota bacterium]|nr:hypothetical protein [Planctomycetota bacterium]